MWCVCVKEYVRVGMCMFSIGIVCSDPMSVRVWARTGVCVCVCARARACVRMCICVCVFMVRMGVHLYVSVVVCLCLYAYRFSRHFLCCKTW